MGLTIYMCLPFQSHHADRVKKLHPAQGGLDSRIPVGFRNDLVDVERQKNKAGATGVARNKVIAGQLNHTPLLTTYLTRG